MWEELLGLEASGRFRSARLRAAFLQGQFPDSLQGHRAGRKRSELEGRLAREVRDSLRGIATAERSYFQEKDRYSTDLRELGFFPWGRPAYTYGFLEACGEADGGVPHVLLTNDSRVRGAFDDSEMAPFDVATVAALLARNGLHATVDCRGCPNCGFMAMAVSDLDLDEALDVWVVGSWAGLFPIRLADDLAPDAGW